MNILGISCFYHDAAACLVKDGVIVAAAQEERFTRIKHDQSFPEHAALYCLKAGSIRPEDLDIIAFYDKPLLTFERLLETYIAYAPRGLGSFLLSMPVWLKHKLKMKKFLAHALEGFQGKVLFCEHHESHAASAFYPSPFNEAAIITMDGVGEWTTTSWGTGSGNTISLSHEIRFPHSLGLLYSAFTYYAGFRVNSGEYKLMGLAPYGEPKYVDIILKEIIDLKPDGSFRVNMRYFNYCAGLAMTSDAFHSLFGGQPRKPESPITQKEMDIARSIQEVTEKAVIHIARHIARSTGMRNLCMAGGVALNCVATGKLMQEKIFENIWIQPAAGDSGAALGAALAIWHRMLGMPRNVDGKHDLQSGSCLGPEYGNDEIADFLKSINAPFEHYSEAELAPKCAGLIAEGKVLGWFSGRMEFGPRALGNRSILGDPRSGNMQSVMNLKIKQRESFRPFAPSVLADKASEWFDLSLPSPYMLIVAPVKNKHRMPMTDNQNALFGIDKLNVKRSSIPAVTHIDYSARIQTVSGKHNKAYFALLQAFNDLTKCPMLINTSFNVRGEPIVNTPHDAYRCFMRTGMDYLVLGNYLLEKGAQPALPDDGSWKSEFTLD